MLAQVIVLHTGFSLKEACCSLEEACVAPSRTMKASQQDHFVALATKYPLVFSSWPPITPEFTTCQFRPQEKSYHLFLNSSSRFSGKESDWSVSQNTMAKAVYERKHFI